MTFDNGDEAPPSGGFKWTKYLLVASLAFNLLFVGGFVSALWDHHEHRGRGGLLGFADRLPADRQQMFRDEVRAGRQTTKALREALRSDWTAANAMLAEEPFDIEKFKAALGKITDDEMRLRSQIYAAVANMAGKMTPEERVIFKDWRERTFGRRLGRPYKDKPE